MVFEELEQRYGPYVAETVRQALTLDEFSLLEVEELAAYFSLRAERSYEELYTHQNESESHQLTDLSRDQYLEVLRKRWQKAEEIAHMVVAAEKMFLSQESQSDVA